MLIFGKGLKIAFWNDRSQRTEGVIKFKSHLEKYSYVVNIFEFGKVTEKLCTVNENQITHVLVKNYSGTNVWVKIEDLYARFPNGAIIKPDEKYELRDVASMYPKLPAVRYQQLSTNSLNYMIRDEEAIKHLLKKEVKTMNILSFEVEHTSICDDTMRCRLDFEIDINEAYKYEPLMRQTRELGGLMLSAFLDATNLPKPKKVIFHGPATIVMWQDGTKTVVKKTENDTDDREKAVMFAILKKACGSRGNMNRYLKLFKEVKSNEEKKEETNSGELSQCEQGAGEGSSEGAV